MGGYPKNILVKCGEDNSFLIDKITHCLSCESGKTLGPELIGIGSRTFFGYDEEFKFVHSAEHHRTGNFLDDDAAHMFLDPAFEIIRTLVNGGTSKEAFENSQEKSKNNMRLVSTSANILDQDKEAIITRLFYNFKHQVLIGDGTAVL